MGGSWDVIALPPKFANVRCPVSHPPLIDPSMDTW